MTPLQMRKLIFIIGLLTTISCGQVDNPSDSADSDTTTVSHQEAGENQKPETILINVADLKKKIFDIGSKTHFTDTCAFYFECDCCSGDLIFNNDSTFYLKDYCVSDETVTFGHYSITNNIISLDYSGLYVSKTQNEADTSQISYFETDTVIKPISLKYIPSLCNDKIMLTEQNGKELAISTHSEYDSAIKQLKADNFIDRLKKLKTAANIGFKKWRGDE